MRRFTRVIGFLLLATVWAEATVAATGPAELLRDIELEPGSRSISSPPQPAGDRVVFTAATPSTGIELWGSDGSPLGTELLHEILPGPDWPRIQMLGTVRRRAVFLADDGNLQAFGLWRSDGTREGTVRIDPLLGRCSIRPWPALLGHFLYFVARREGEGCRIWRTNSETVEPVEEPTADFTDVRELTPAGNRLFFFKGGALWVTEGALAGTRMLRELASPEGPRELTAAGARVFFLAPGAGAGGEEEELWVSDGTTAGTRQVSRFGQPLPFHDIEESLIDVFDGILYFVADDGTGFDLWRSDGTRAGTRRVTDFANANPFFDSFSGIHLVELDGRLLFRAIEEQTGGWQLWVSRGTPATTRQLTGCPGGCPRSVEGGPFRYGQRAVFTSSQEPGRGLWITDGTGAGTRLLDRLCAFDCGLNVPVLLGQIFYLKHGSSEPDLYELWRSDGTRRGTIRLTPNVLRFAFEAPFEPVAAGQRIFFRGAGLWTSDGAPEGTGQVPTLGSMTDGSSPTAITSFLDGVIFGAKSIREDRQWIWRSDGTSDGTQEIHASRAFFGRRSPFPRPVVSGGLAFFLRSDDGDGGVEDFSADLWRTDGTEGGTFRLIPDEVWIEAVSPFGNGAVFLVNEWHPERTTLWASDGTVAGTRPLVPLPSRPWKLWTSKSRIYFVEPGSLGPRLWISDGTEAGTHLLGGFGQPAFAEGGEEPEEVGETIFFAAGNRLWKSDGTTAGTVAVLPDSAEGRAPADLTAFQGLLYFLADTGQGEFDRGLWRSDGTAAGTLLVRSLGPAERTSSGRLPSGWLTVVGDQLYFAAGDGEHGMELWKSDGTAEGTAMVRDIFPGEGSSSPSRLTAAPGRLFFVANDGPSGPELWESDGTEAGTRRVQDIFPGVGGSDPHDLTLHGQRLFFAANDGVHGEEPWILPLTTGGCTPSAVALCLGGRFRVEAEWRSSTSNQGTGRAVALSADTGIFWFFDAANVEVILKVLDGRGLNGHHWVFYGALSNVEYVLTVTDTQTGAVRRYINPPGRLGSLADTEAFGPRGANLANPLTFGPTPKAQERAGEALARVETAPATGSCVPSATRLCLNDGRFAVEARWRDFEGNTGTGKAVPLAGGDTGYFWFFDQGNVEVVLKVLDGRPVNGKLWVFYGALSTVEYTLTVTDTLTGAVRTYTNPSGRLASVADTGAF